ncbi:MAG: hypothetical protein Q8J97_03225, partial [Flavobacteriaceae bacterium]|nr:hypothetical protein [Flavobacteriaceae bacterium]
MRVLVATDVAARSLDIDQVRADSGAWVEYVDQVTTQVTAMLTSSVLSSLTNLRHQMDPVWLMENGGIPLLDIKLTLTRPSAKARDDTPPTIVFEPPLYAENSPHSLESLFEHVMERMIHITENVKQIDVNSRAAGLTFLPQVAAEGPVLRLVEEIRALVARNASKCEEFVTTFSGYAHLFEESVNHSFHQFLRQAAEREAERPHDTIIDGPKVVPYFDGVPLIDYDLQIRKYEEMYDELEDLPMSHMAYFVKIDSKPVRSGILDLCARWRDAFLNHLINTITSDLNGLYEFIAVADKGLNNDVIDGDLDSLKKVMRCIRDCRRKNDQVSAMLEPISQAVLMLRTYPTINPETIERIEELRKPAPEMWNALYKKSLNVRAQNSLVQDREAEKVKEQLGEFEDKIARVATEFRKNDLFKKYKVVSPIVYDQIDSTNRHFKEIEGEGKDLQNLQELFDLTPSEFKELRECRSELVMLKHVW